MAKQYTPQQFTGESAAEYMALSVELDKINARCKADDARRRELKSALTR